MKRLILSLLLLLFSSFSFAVDYFWFAESRTSLTGPSAQSVCTTANAIYFRPGGVNRPIDTVSLRMVSSTKAVCDFTMNPDWGSPTSFNLSRSGNSCPADKPIYNAETGACEPDNSCEAGADSTLEWRIGSLNADKQLIGGWSNPPDTVCQDSCSFESPSIQDLYHYPGGDKDGVFAKVSYRGVGEACSVSDGDSPPDSGTDGCQATEDAEGRKVVSCAPPPDPDNQCPAGYSWSGTTCVSSDGTGGSGEGDGDTGDGGDGGEGGGETPSPDPDGSGSGDGSGGDGTGSGDGSGGDGSGSGSPGGGGGANNGDDGQEDQQDSGGSSPGESPEHTAFPTSDEIRASFVDVAPVITQENFNQLLEKHSNSVQASNFGAFARSFVPSFSGSCPSWSLSLNLGSGMNFGSHSFSSICYVFDFIKVCILLSAMFLCRRLIFGG